MSTSLKERKEQFVSGLTGGSTLEIYSVTAVSFLAYYAYLFLYQRLKNDPDNKPVIVILDFLLNWVFLLLSVTIYANDTQQLIMLLLLPVVAVFLYQLVVLKRKTKLTKATKKKITLPLNASTLIPFKSFLTVYRSQMMIITMIAILAVDFKIFPRRFAKVETWGTSLMDLGVGSFVFSYGLFSSRPVILNKFNGKQFSFAKMLWKSVRDSFPLLVLGLIRFISVKSVDYQEHVTEYGVHWNFFFTLGFMPIFATISLWISRFIPQLILSLVISVIYEIVLIRYDLLKFILIAPRVDLVSQNREGIFSFIGFLAIFLAGQGCGFFVLPGLQTPNNIFRPSSMAEIKKSLDTPGSKSKFQVSPLKGLISLSVLYQVTYYIVETCYSYSVSRRLANFLYVIWVCGYNTTFLTAFYLISRYYHDAIEIDYTSEQVKSENAVIKEYYLKTTPLSLEALNKNGLILFLISNLLTGLVNMSVNTLDAKYTTSLLILVLYSSILAGISILLYHYKIFIKL